ncbi:amidohydrolase [Olegusella massiliensis]|uniref:amidohydrolase n=1 Tax=Olegusella massiliensis TaxID=1776381 RepID=UPI000A8565AE|nr:amidohydrolase family protein [Olegusella massiliensis]
MSNASYILKSSAIFDSVSNACFAGFVAVEGNQIIAVGEGNGSQHCGPSTKVLELGDKLITPGLVDVHCFFNGWLLQHAGADLSQVTSLDEAIELVKAQPRPNLFIGHDLPMSLAVSQEKKMDDAFGDVPAVLVSEGAEAMVMNTAAEKIFGFTPAACWSEKAYLLLKAVIEDTELSLPLYRDYQKMMNSYGVTSTKEMGYDDYWFIDEVKKLEDAGELSLRVNLMSQPVGEDANISYGVALKNKFEKDPFISFSGFNQMTDGSISQTEGEMKEPYLDSDTCCALDIDWKHHEDEVLKADAAGLRFSLHTQGDGAVSHAIDIFEKCSRDENGHLVLRQAMTDLECADPKDYERMAKLGIVAEVYPLIQSIADRKSKLEMISTKIGAERGTHYWNRRAMLDAGITVSCGTDLPMTKDDLGVGVYSACGGFFPEGGEPFNPNNMISSAELLHAWTAGSSYDLEQEDSTGTLEEGKLADIAVFDKNILDLKPEDARSCSCCLTMVDGRIVYSTL